MIKNKNPKSFAHLHFCVKSDGGYYTDPEAHWWIHDDARCYYEDERSIWSMYRKRCSKHPRRYPRLKTKFPRLYLVKRHKGSDGIVRYSRRRG